MKKRTFLKSISMASIPALLDLTYIDKAVKKFEDYSARELSSNEDFWAVIRSGYKLKPDYINLESGYYCLLPEETLENHIHHIRAVNYDGSYYMRKQRDHNKKRITQKLANLIGADPEEIGITRNTTESLDLIIAGYPWKAGDEAIMASQDYGAMKYQMRMMEKRYGIVVREISVPDHPAGDEEIVKLYADAITPRTKLLMVCHMINISGQILPVKKIADMAHSKGVEVMVDGAHTIGHLNFTIPDLGCDYFGSSLHKWLSVPLGAGLLYVKKEKIPKIWPLMASWGRDQKTIQNLNHTGTNPVHVNLTIFNAIEYYERMGAQRKEERLRFLQNYWTDQVRDHKGIILNTPADRQRSCAIANVGVEGLPPNDLARKLMDDYHIWTVAINGPVYGCRITPNVFTTREELDQLVYALKEIAG